MALITNTDTSILPYNSKYMVYDLDRQMYVLTNEGVYALVGVNLVELTGNDNLAELVRYEISEDVMSYISRYSLNETYKFKQWLLAKDETLRVIFERILTNQTRYYVRSGAGLLKDMHGVNIEKSKSLDLFSIRGKTLISTNAETMLLNSGLLYTGRMYYPDYSDDGTW